MDFPVRMIKRQELLNLYGQVATLEKIVGQATSFVADIERGNLSTSIIDADHQLLAALTSMQARLQQIAAEERERNWATEGLAKFANILRQHQELKSLGDTIITHLVNYAGAHQGALFLLADQADEAEPLLEMMACYAHNRKKYLQKKIGLHEGLAGQAVLERDTIFLTQVPPDYLSIASGLGSAVPASVLIVPLKTNDQVVGVVELAAFRPFKAHEISFVEKVGESIAAAILAVQNAERTLRLLGESQTQSNELRQREEEMRQNMEELESTQEAARRAEEEASRGRNMLNSLINSTNDSIMVVGKDYRIQFVNGAVRQRYKGSDYDGVATGVSVLEMLAKGDPKVRAEWEDYYTRGLNGETLDFTAESTIKGDQSFRQYSINPIREEGEVIATAVISRDVTQQKSDEEKVRRLLAEAQQHGQELMRTQLNITAITNTSKESMLMINTTYHVIFVNETLKRRYQGTAYEQLEEGANVLDVMGNSFGATIQQEWKAYYDRALRGEYFDMVLESVVQNGPSTFRYYYVSPIVFDGQVVGVAIFSSDITGQRQAELEVDRLTQLLLQRESIVEQQAQELNTLRQQLAELAQ